MRALGVDPGTKSFDLVVVEEGRVVWEDSIETGEVARDPGVLVESVMSAGADVVAGPSGYGVPVTWNRDIVDARRFAVEVLLLSTEEEIRRGVEEGDPGIMVYAALARVVEELWRSRVEAVYIPSVVLLPTVPAKRKVNRIDMGTADKMSVAVLAAHLARRRGVETFAVVEMGYGYNAVVGVEKGRIVDGLGGTVLGPGLLTIGPVDGEIAALAGTWGRRHVFRGGAFEACGTLDPEEAWEKYLEGREPCTSAIAAVLEAVARGIVSVCEVSLGGARKVYVSGRLTALPGMLDEIRALLPQGYEVERLELLEGASRSKHAAQGYALVAEGLAGGSFRDLVSGMGIPEARGTVMDHVLHPALAPVKERLRRAYAESVRGAKL